MGKQRSAWLSLDPMRTCRLHPDSSIQLLSSLVSSSSSQPQAFVLIQQYHSALRHHPQSGHIQLPLAAQWMVRALVRELIKYLQKFVIQNLNLHLPTHPGTSPVTMAISKSSSCDACDC
jgi:hypothetical protein